MVEACLRGKGWRMLSRRWRCRLGELDIVALDGATVVFVEVRWRTDLTHGRPEETVGPLKQRRLAVLAAAWLASENRTSSPCRFDVCAVSPGPDGLPRIEHFVDAFRPR